jgi:hypothetical protein
MSGAATRGIAALPGSKAGPFSPTKIVTVVRAGKADTSTANLGSGGGYERYPIAARFSNRYHGGDDLQVYVFAYVLTALAVLGAARVQAQEVEPNEFVPLPAGTNLVLGY